MDLRRSYANGTCRVALAIVNDTIFAIGGNPLYISSTSANEQYFPLDYGTPDPITTTPSPTPTFQSFHG